MSVIWPLSGAVSFWWGSRNKNTRKAVSPDMEYIEQILRSGEGAVDIHRARDFMYALHADCPDELVSLAIPIARRVMDSPEWVDKMKVSDVIKFVIDRKEAFEYLSKIPAKPVDCCAEYLGCCAHNLAKELGIVLPP